jgi:peptidoglycan biosynthesis protein MviN/MurJ (putative lipid II flippase)
MNILGGVLLVTNSFYYHALPSVGVNVAWIGIAAFALVKRFNQPSIKSD